MATKPNETYKWGENATHEQVAAYEDTGWPSDAIPPKRTQFNWYQNLVGRWLGWVEDAVDEIVETVLDAWFVELPNSTMSSVPRVNGIYRYSFTAGGALTVLVQGDIAVRVASLPSTGFKIELFDWDNLTSTWTNRQRVIERANTRSEILSDPISETDYVTPKGLVDYFSVKDTTYTDPTVVPHKSGMHIIKGTLSRGFAFVADDSMASVALRGVDQIYIEVYEWSGTQWVLQ